MADDGPIVDIDLRRLACEAKGGHQWEKRSWYQQCRRCTVTDPEDVSPFFGMATTNISTEESTHANPSTPWYQRLFRGAKP